MLLTEEQFDTLRNALAILLAGVLIGGMGALFLATLRLADSTRLALVDFTAAHAIPSWLAVGVAAAAGAALAAWLAQRWTPNAPQLSVSEDTEGRKAASDLHVLGVNFAGTGLAVGAGFAIGPERPAIQMGGAVGRVVGRVLRMNRPDQELLVAAAGGAGVATMFNSPLGCTAYTVECVIRQVDHRKTMITLAVGAIAVAVTRVLVGRDVNFVVQQMPHVHVQNLLLYVPLGAVLAVVSTLHTRLILLMTGLFARVSLPGAVRGAAIGGTIGLLAWYAPGVVGVGDALTQGVLDGKYALSFMALLFLLRFFLGPLSLAAGTPGGYFTPVLLLGALSGAMYGTLISQWLPEANLSPTAFALVGMAVALATVAGAPFTGILLVMETTGAFALALPMTIAVLCASAVSRLLFTPSLGHGLETILARFGERRRARRTAVAKATGKS